jgi:cytosine/adenosine deaminase-related metal-dependent hydrolase
MSTIVIEGAQVVTLDPQRREFAGHVVAAENRIVAVGPGPAASYDGARVVDGRGCLVTPGFVNTHQHLYQWVTRGLAADATLFGWLTTLYPVWARISEESVYVAAQAALAQLARTGCTTAADHHYVFPRGGGDVLAAEIQAAAEVGLRFHPSRGSMDRGQKDGGLPPDSVVEDRDEILTATEAAIDRWHDPSADSMLQIVVAPCSPFSVSGELMRDAAELARQRGVRMHTHLAETTDEADWCRQTFNCTLLEYAAGIARTADLRAAGSPVGLGVDGAASNEAGSLVEELRHALLFARARGGPQSLDVRAALEMATLDGARILGREADIGSLEPGKLADLAVWNLNTRLVVQEVAVDPDCLDVGGGAQGEDPGQDFFGVGGVGDADGQGGAVCGPDELGVEAFAYAQVADLREGEGVGACGGGEVEQVGGGERTALVAEELLGEVRLQTLLKQREPSAGPNIGSQRHPYAELQMPCEREQPAPQCRIARRAMRDRRPADREHLEFDVGRVHIVREHRTAVHQAVPVVRRHVVAASEEIGDCRDLCLVLVDV